MTGVIDTMVNWYQRHFLAIEFFVAIIITAFWMTLAPRVAIAHNIETNMHKPNGALYPTLATLAGTLLGFSMTAITVVLSFVSAHALEIVRKSGHLVTIVTIYRQTILWLGLTTVWSLVVPMLSNKQPVPGWSVDIEFYFLTISSLRLYRSLWVLFHLWKIVYLSERPLIP